MDRFSNTHSNPKNESGKASSSSGNASSSDLEGTFLPVATCDSAWENISFVNAKFADYEDEDVIKIIDLQKEEKPPLFLLFPDLEDTDRDRLDASTSTTQVAQILMGKKADFSLLRRAKKLNNPEQNKMDPLVEAAAEDYPSDDQDQEPG